MKLSLGACLLLVCTPAMAHHGNAEFDLSQQVKYEGTIVEVLWRNPHTVTRIETRTAAGEPITLELEGSSPSILRTGGFTAESAVDAAGMLARKTDENGVAHRYQHDALGRLVRVDTPDGAHTVSFDRFGRPAQITRDHVGAIVYAYDATTGLLTQKQRLDATGAVVDTSLTRYDAIGRPAQISRSGGTVAPGDTSDLRFDYDGQVDGSTAPGQLGRLTRARGDGWARSELFDPLGRMYYRHVALAGWRDVTTDTTYRADGSMASDTVTIADSLGYPGLWVGEMATPATPVTGSAAPAIHWRSQRSWQAPTRRPSSSATQSASSPP